MKKSPLELIHYFVTDLSISANMDHDPAKEINLSLKDLKCTNRVRRIEGHATNWSIFLSVEQDTRPNRNSPYNFRISVSGVFELQTDFPADRAERFVTANGSAILFSVAREALRSGMSAGPYPPLLLPGVHFVPEDSLKWTSYALRFFDIGRVGLPTTAQRFLVGVPKIKLSQLAASASFSKYTEDALFREALSEARSEITPYLAKQFGNGTIEQPVILERLVLPTEVPTPDFKTSTEICYWKESEAFKMR